MNDGTGGMNSYVSFSSSGLYNISIDNNIPIVDTSDFVDRTMFADDISSHNQFDECTFLPFTIFGTGCYDNTFGTRCSYNSFGTGCSYNSFGTGCYSNTFPNSSYKNELKDVHGKDYTLSTHFSTNASTLIHQMAGGNVYQTYIDVSGTPALAIVTDNIGVN